MAIRPCHLYQLKDHEKLLKTGAKIIVTFCWAYNDAWRLGLISLLWKNVSSISHKQDSNRDKSCDYVTRWVTPFSNPCSTSSCFGFYQSSTWPAGQRAAGCGWHTTQMSQSISSFTGSFQTAFTLYSWCLLSPWKTATPKYLSICH